MLLGGLSGLTAMGLGTSCLTQPVYAVEPSLPGKRFRYSLNMATIRGQKLSPVEEVDIAAEAGYQGIEPWIDRLREFAGQGGSLSDLKKRIDDHGLVVENVIGFSRWIFDNDAEQQVGLEKFEADMELAARIGATRIAAPPSGVTSKRVTDLDGIAKNYAAILRLGQKTGVMPQIELWGISKTLCRLGEIAYVLAATGHPEAGAVLDVFHIFKGGSSFEGLAVFNGRRLPVFHVNDYLSGFTPERITDADRVMPGDGAAPLTKIFQTLASIGFEGALSLELFGKTFWEQDPRLVARLGLQKMRDGVQKALS